MKTRPSPHGDPRAQVGEHLEQREHRAAGDVGPKPEMTRVDATLYISRPTGVRVRRRVVRIERERVLVPAGHSVESKHTRREADVVELIAAMLPSSACISLSMDSTLSFMARIMSVANV